MVKYFFIPFNKVSILVKHTLVWEYINGFDRFLLTFFILPGITQGINQVLSWFKEIWMHFNSLSEIMQSTVHVVQVPVAVSDVNSRFVKIGLKRQSLLVMLLCF